MAIQLSDINRKLVRLSLTILVVLVLFYMLLNNHPQPIIRVLPCDQLCRENLGKGTIENNAARRELPIAIGITLCGPKAVRLGITAIKSILMFTHIRPHFMLMTDFNNMSEIGKKLNELNWNNSFTYEIRPTQFPSNSKVWRRLFQECASQRLFYPYLLSTYDRILYIDADILFLSPVEELWSNFDRMNGSQMAAMVVESLDLTNNWYHRHAKHPFVRPYGVNTGVMLMDLKKMRHFHWSDRLEPILKTYQNKLPWGDQDIINVIFSDQPDKLLILQCHWNYRTDFCLYRPDCPAANEQGIKVLHGNRGLFLTDRYPVFQAIYQAIEKFDLKKDCRQDLINEIKAVVGKPDKANPRSNCDETVQFVMKSIK